MTDVKQLKEERYQNLVNIYTGKMPSRVPLHTSISFEACVAYAKMKGRIAQDYSLREISWETEKWFDIFDPVNEDFFSDSATGAGAFRFPLLYQILEAKCINMSSSGVMQHPEVHSLEPEEYDKFIEDPFYFMSEVLMPRLYPALDTTPGRRAMILAQAAKANFDQTAIAGGIMAKISEKYGFVGFPGGRSTAPFDFLADFLRSFTGISSDIRRYPQKVLAACDALTPLMLRESFGSRKPDQLPEFFRTNIPLHMGSFLNQKHFEKFWWPSFKTLMDNLVEGGIGHGVDIFVEDDWMRHMDYLKELEGCIRMQFEYGDEKFVKEKLSGTKHVITGFFPVNTIIYGKKQDVLDKAKEQIDILAPGGGYIMGFDKGLMHMNEQIAENLRALGEFVREYAVYNKGELTC